MTDDLHEVLITRGYVRMKRRDEMSVSELQAEVLRLNKMLVSKALQQMNTIDESLTIIIEGLSMTLLCPDEDTVKDCIQTLGLIQRSTAHQIQILSAFIPKELKDV